MSSLSPSNSSTGRPRSNSYTSSVKEFQIGTKVLIIETENVVQRARHLIGKIGSICEVPVHPATWYKVEFPEHPVVTFRPSAFKIISSDHDFDPLDMPSNLMLRIAPKVKHSSPSHKFKSKLKPLYSKSSLRTTSDSVHTDGERTNEDGGDHDDEHDQDDDTVTSKAANHDIDTSATHTGGSEIKHKALILDTLDPEVWIGCSVKVIGGKNHLEEAKVMRTGNGWVQIVTVNGEEVAKRAHELEVLQLPAGVTRPIHNRAGTNIARRKVVSSSSSTSGSSSHHHNEHGYDDGRPRPRRLGMKRGVDGETRISSSSNHHHHAGGDDSSDTKDANHWTKELRRAIHIDEKFTCSYTSLMSSHVDEEVCRHCYTEKWPGSKLCWNEDCISSPSYHQHPWKNIFPYHRSSPTINASQSHDDMDVVITQPTTPPTDLSPTSDHHQQLPLMYDRIMHHDDYHQYDNVKKCRSDSTLTDQEYASPELSAMKDEASSHAAEAMSASIVLPSNPSMPFIAYDDKKLGFAFYNPYAAPSHKQQPSSYRS